MLEILSVLAAVKELIQIGIALFNFARTQYEKQERLKFLQEIRASVQESIQTGDNSRLNNVLNPNSEPFPRKP